MAVPHNAHLQIRKILDNVGHVISGKRDVVRNVVVAMLARGHVMLEDMPGVGKTMLARALAKSIDCDFKRIQCTPDLLPVDITGYVDPRNQTFRPGPVFTQILLADELNRATPRTQSALLEAMGEGQVTVDGVTHSLPNPFFVIATQNPAEHRGVNDLPEAQLDRFMLMVSPGYPSEAEEQQMLRSRMQFEPLAAIGPVIGAGELAALFAAVPTIHVADAVMAYIVTLVRSTRHSKLLQIGASPRAALQLMRLAQANAMADGRDYVIPDDVKTLAANTLPHRVVPAVQPNEEIGASEWKRRCILQILAQIPPPDQ